MLARFFRSLARRNVLIATGALSVALAVILQLIDRRFAPGSGKGVVSFQLAFTLPRAEQILTLWGERGRELFLGTVWLDYIFPVACGLFLAGVLAAFRRHKPESEFQKQMVVFAVPLVAVVFDWLENSLQVISARNFPALSAQVVLWTGLFAAIKFFFFIQAVFMVVFFWFKRYSKPGTDE